MSIQRRRAQDFILYPIELITDARGNQQYQTDWDNPIQTKGWMIPQRSTKAEVPGQQLIDVIRVGVNADLTDSGLEYDRAGVGVYGVCRWRGADYDIVAPPAYHHGVRRHTRHWSIDIRERPN